MARLSVIAAALAAVALAPAAAYAGGGKSPPAPPPNDHCNNWPVPKEKCDTGAGDTIDVQPADLGDCPAGGVQITVTHHPVLPPPKALGDPPAGPPSDPLPFDVFFVCNGVPGEDGEPGPPGPPGQPGAPGPAGAPGADGLDGLPGLDGQDGQDGLDGRDGRDGQRGATGPPGSGALNTSCVSSRVGRWRIIVRRVHRVRNVRISFEGVRAPFRETRVRGRRVFVARIDMRGLRGTGPYVARVRYDVSNRGGSFRRGTNVHYWRTCLGNPRGGGPEGMNRFPVQII